MKGALVSLALLIPLAAGAQTPYDFSKARLAQRPLSFPDKPIESSAPSEPDMGIYKPAGPGPFPALILSHNCAGIMDHIGDWTNLLVTAGYVAFVVDSFTQRYIRLGENCKFPPRMNTSESTLDAYHALEHLAGQPYVDKERIGLLGFSWGAMVGLLAARKDIADILPRQRRELRFRAVASLYPHCFIPEIRLPQGGAMSVEWLGPATDRPLLVLMGERDEETPPKFCLPRLEALKAAGANVDWQVYPGATHFWDGRRYSGHANDTFYGVKHVIRFNAEVTRASQQRVLQFMAREMPAK